MDSTDQPGVPPGLLAGRLEGISVADLLWAICSRRKTGTLELWRDEVHKTVYIQNGEIVFAASGDPDDRLGELLLRHGTIVLKDLDEALSNSDTGRRLGTLLVEVDRLSPDDLVQGVIDQVRGIVLELFEWEWGEYRFKEGPLETQEVITLGMRTGEILLQGIRRIRSFTRIRRSVGPLSTPYRLAAEWEVTLEALDLTDGEEMLISKLRDGAATVEKLCGEVFLSNFEVHQALWALKIIGVVEESERVVYASAEGAPEGLLGRRGVAPVLVGLCRTGETGVLYVIRGSVERTIHVKEGACVFATSNDVEDSLLAHLLRRGVISLKDRDETMKRLLSNKRVGTILRDLGVIDAEDLDVMVREQLSELVHDTLAWDSGEYRFVSGELPTIEEITLDRTIESLVASGLRRVTSWTRVRKGCGGLNTRVALSPRHMDILDRMDVGAEEWEIVSALAEPQSPLEICERSSLGDFTVCQILWILKTLGAVERAAVQDKPRLEPDSTEHAAALAPLPLPLPVPEPVQDEPFEVSSIQEMMPAKQDDPSEAIEPSVWAGEEENAPVDGLPLRASDETALELSEDVTETEILRDTESQLRETEARILQAEPEPDFRAETGQAVPAGSTTCYVSREEVESALAREPEDDSAAIGQTAVESGWEELEIKHGDTETEQGAGTGLEPTEQEPGEPDAIDEVLAAEPEPDVEWPDPEVEEAEAEPEEEIPEEPAPTPAYFGGTTTVIPRDQVEAILGGELPEETGERPVEPDWEPPPDLESQIARFNARQRRLYRTIRAEVGAGAANFIRSCAQKLTPGAEDPFVGAELKSDGSWDVESLKRAARQHQVDDPWSDYQRLLEVELEMLRIHIGEPRANVLRREIEELETSGSAGV